MIVQTLTVPSADEQLKLVYNRKVRKGNSIELPLNQKLACVVLQFNGIVVPNDYPALKVAMEAIPGIQAVNLLIDGTTPISIPENSKLMLVCDVQLRIDNLPEEP